MTKKKYYYNFGRSAFKHGLLSYNLNTEKKILIPDFICNEITNALNELSISYRFYSLKDDLKPDWDNLKKIKTNDCSAVMMVHYFGNTQDIEKFTKYSKENNLLLIEDNAHGFGGKYNFKEIGTFGDFGISSPRKIINTKYGGILYKNSDYIISLPLSKNFTEIIFSIAFYIKNKLILIVEILKKFLMKRPVYENPYTFKEKNYEIFKLDCISYKIIRSKNLENIKKSRLQIYDSWKIFSEKNNLKPVYKSLNKGSIPWCFPVYVPSEQERINLLNWGWENKFNIFTWPSLPIEIIKNKTDGYNKWKKLICFSTDPDNAHIKNYL